MIVTDVGFHPLSKKITLFVGSILLTNIVTAHKCFVCGPNNVDTNVENNDDLIPTCDRFNPNDSTFIHECLPESKGCSIQTNGTVLTRTCERRAIVDCKIANNVEYCYCNTDFCNKHHPTRADDITDDDDEEEGSGTERHFVTDLTNVLQVPNMPSSTAPTTSSTVTFHRLNISTVFIILIFVFILTCDMYFIL